MKQRNETYDLMKGIAMILMMLCHLVYTEGSVKQFIYSFHMPLFFILAGVFAKNIEEISSFKDYTSKNAKRLLLPYVVTMLMLCAWGGVQAVAKQDVSFFLRHLFSMLTASADGWQTKWGLVYAGPMWFLIALFWVREIFYGIQRVCKCMKKYRDELVVGLSVALSIASVLIHPYLPSLPFCSMQACTALAFYAVGWYIHNQDFYDRYDRNGTKVYLGEWASRGNKWENALVEALHMTNLERNADVVVMSSYAPLFCKDGHSNWNPDLIYFNNTSVRPTPGYYVQKAFGVNNGVEYIPTALNVKGNQDVQLRVNASVVKAENGDLIVKMVNLLPSDVKMTINFGNLDGYDSKNAVWSTMTGKPGDGAVTSTEATKAIETSTSCTLASYSFTVIRIKKAS